MSSDDKIVLNMWRRFDFYEKTMNYMEEMRDETWSDITLKVGYRSFYAHRLVLAAHSGYFKTLFLGNFSDSKSKEVDLSSVIDDADILEDIVKFMYHGKIECTKRDFWGVARLASYFEMEMLMSACEERMHQEITLDNCVEYYVFANSHGYSNIEEKAYKVIEPRFHDYIVFQDSALELKPKDLILMLEGGFFKNCGNATFLEFLGNWVAKGCTDQYVEVAKAILDYLDQDIKSDFTVVAHKSPINALEECHKNLESKLVENETKVDKDLGGSFLGEFKRLVSQILGAKEIPIDDEENVVITLCKRKKRMFVPGLVSKKQYDIFLFREHSNCWYHINTVDNKPSWYTSEKSLPFKRKNNKFFVVGKTLVFVRKNSKIVIKFDMEKNEWSEFTLPSVQSFSERLSDVGNEFAACNDELYVVITKPDVEPVDSRYFHEDDPIDVNGCFFQIYKVNIQNGSMTKIATTSLCPFEYDQYESEFLKYKGLRSSAHVQINKASGDMLVLMYIDEYLGDRCEIIEIYVPFVVNIKDGSTHFFPTETNDKLKYPFHDLYIVEKEDRFLIVHYQYVDEDICEVIAEYKFLSKKIVFTEGFSKPDSKFPDFCEEEPVEPELYHGGGSGLWYFDDLEYTCSFKYFPLEEEVSEKECVNGDKNVKDNIAVGKSVKEDSTKDRNTKADEDKITACSAKEVGNEERNVKGKADRTAEDTGSEEVSVKENEIKSKGIEDIPPPFTTVRCVCQAKMSKELLSKLKPVRKFLL